MTGGEDKAELPAMVRGRYTPLGTKQDDSKRRQGTKQDGELPFDILRIKTRRYMRYGNGIGWA
jgi:hypothetical protein